MDTEKTLLERPEILNFPLFNDNAEQQFSLAKLSPQARQLINLAVSIPGKLLEFVEQPDQAWKWAEETVGALSARDRYLLEMLAALFLPSSADSVIIIPVIKDEIWGGFPWTT